MLQQQHEHGEHEDSLSEEGALFILKPVLANLLGHLKQKEWKTLRNYEPNIDGQLYVQVYLLAQYLDMQYRKRQPNNGTRQHHALTDTERMIFYIAVRR